MYTQYSICWRWNVANELAEARRYVEENITILSMIISSSHSYIFPYLYLYNLYIYLHIYIISFQVLHNSRVFLLLNVLYTNKARFFRARSFCVAKSNANQNSHGLLKYLGSINSYLKSSNAGQHRTKWTSLSTADRQRERERDVKRLYCFKLLPCVPFFFLFLFWNRRSR